MTSIQHKPKVKFIIPVLLVFIALTFLTIMAKIISKPELENIFKPLLMPTLIVLYILNTKLLSSKDSIYILAALIFSMLGDIFLMPYFDNFILGLLSFLTGHFFYILIFSNLNKGKLLKGLKKNRILALAIMFTYLSLIGLLITTMNKTNTDLVLIIAVVIYASVITLMVMNSASLYLNYKSINELLILIGALLFMLSDSLIAINKFVHPIELPGLYIMTTYCAGQFLIVYGVIRLKFDKKK